MAFTCLPECSIKEYRSRYYPRYITNVKSQMTMILKEGKKSTKKYTVNFSSKKKVLCTYSYLETQIIFHFIVFSLTFESNTYICHYDLLYTWGCTSHVSLLVVMVTNLFMSSHCICIYARGRRSLYHTQFNLRPSLVHLTSQV